VITRTELRQISQLSDPDGHILSLYLQLSQDRTDQDHNIDLKNLFRDAETTYERSMGAPLPQQFQPLFEEIRILVRDHAGRFGKGLALFAVPTQGILAAHSVPGSVESAIRIDYQPDIAQLIHVVMDHEPYCTCLISRDHARILLGRYDEILEQQVLLDAEVPGQHEQGGWAQARYERHIEDHVHRHFKRVAQELFDLLERDPYTFLILGGPEEVVASFRESLHPYVRERVIGEVRLLMEANINDIRQYSMDVVQDWFTRKKGEQVDKVCNEAYAHQLGVHGLTATMEALQRGQVLAVIVDCQIRSSGVICFECDALSVDSGPGNRCRYCGGTVSDVDNIVSAIITNAFKQGADVSVIEDEHQRDELAGIGGIGALLRFRIEQQTA
jgi:peptide chain release factor subunit 1